MSISDRTRKIIRMIKETPLPGGKGSFSESFVSDDSLKDSDYIPSSPDISVNSETSNTYSPFLESVDHDNNTFDQKRSDSPIIPICEPLVISDIQLLEVTQTDVSEKDQQRTTSPALPIGEHLGDSQTQFLEIGQNDDNILSSGVSSILIDTELSSANQNEKKIVSTDTVENITDTHMADSGTLPFAMTEYLNSRVPVSKRSKRIWDKRDFCLYCYEDVTNFSRHLMRKHISETAVQQFMKMRAGSIERKNFIDMLRKKGNYLSPAQNQIRLVRRPTQNVSPENILACEYCKGYYMKRYLKRHTQKCRERPQKKDNENFNPAKAQTNFAFRCVEKDFVSRLRLKEDVLNMRCDKISFIAKSDPLILSFGSFFAKRHRHSHLSKVTRNKMRELARLWENMKLYVDDKTFFEALKPENFKYFVSCTQNITGYDEKTQQFIKAPSLALHMGTTLKKLCDHACSEIQQKNKVFINGIDHVKKAKEIKILRQLVVNNWNAEVSGVANQNLIENQWKNPTIIPLTSDIQKLNSYVKQKANTCVEKLKENKEDRKSFTDLQKCCYALLITLNRRRVGELERLLLDSYLKENDDIISEEFQEKLSNVEKILLNKYKRIRIRGKRHKPVPVLVSTEVQSYVNLLISVRENFIPKTNPYLFATVNKDTCLNGYSSLRSLAQASGAEHPEALTSGKLRKHIATISQIYNLDSSELEQLCTFLGHTMTTHQNFYRLPQEIYQTAKLAKLLLKSQNENVTFDEGEMMNEELQTDNDGDSTDGENANSVGKEKRRNADVSSKTKMRLKQDNRRNSTDSEKEIVGEHTPKRKKITSMTKAKLTRVRWTPDQKNVTKSHFQENIKNKKAPTESEIEVFRKKFPIMENKDWKKIKAFIFNEYNKK